jgi:hypothetical protein
MARWVLDTVIAVFCIDSQHIVQHDSQKSPVDRCILTYWRNCLTFLLVVQLYYFSTTTGNS